MMVARTKTVAASVQERGWIPEMVRGLIGLMRQRGRGEELRFKSRSQA